MLKNEVPRDGVRVEYLLITDTGWSDYSGATWTRSNHRVLARDYGDYLVPVRDSLSFQQWAVRVGSSVPEALVDAIRSLADYAELDEEDESELRSEIEDECWESFGKSDFFHAVGMLAIAEFPDGELPELEDSEFVKRLFYDARRDSEYEHGDFECEGATGGYWRDMPELAKVAWERIKSGR